jgi:hypothetical protein
MRFLHPLATTAALFNVLVGCSATRLPDYSPLSAHQYTHKNTQHGLTVAIHPMTQESEIEQYFGTHLLAHDILPVLVVVENQNVDVSFILRKQEIQLLSEISQSPDATKRSGTVDTSGTAEPVGIAAATAIIVAPPLAIPLLLAVAGMESHAAEVRRNFAMKELQQITVSPGDTKSGFVYFQLPNPASSPDRWRFQIQALDLKSKMPLTFTYVYDWKRR